jgi:PAS domain S-box-containing protein
MSSPPNLNAYLGQVPVGIIVVDETGTVIDYNDQALRLLGIQVEDFLTGDLPKVLSSPDLAAMVNRVISGKKNAEELTIEKEGRRVRCFSTRSGAEGNTTTLIAGDATDSYRMQRMEQEFLGTILHGLRSPLATLKTSLGLLSEQEGLTYPQAKEIIRMCTSETNRLHAYLTDLRHAFLIETGEAVRERTIEAFTLSALFEGVLKLVGVSSVVSLDTKSRILLEGAADCTIRADFEYAKTAVGAVIRNALLFSKEDQPVHIAASPAESSIRIEIRDRGIGIRPENISKIYRKFFREDNEVTRRHPGSGLGLFLAHSFLSLVGGSIFCESRKGEGSTFYVTLPRSCT